MRIAMLGMLLAAGWCAPAAQAETLLALASPVGQTAMEATAGEEAAIVGVALDDQALADERGSGLGAVTVAATPELIERTHSVTLWDELAPPAPAPVPVDTAKTAQVNVLTTTRR
ncbi:hypothetical protein D7S89_00125 [Trinickia fusca]|uniref:Uncharacterized protein n=2 Tax=Trinickia fusca TaxID=2419777 RepID=A0A494XQD2_9BURK|nr:hypothetical protein D7S89_00125 [Trinickia fusca]